MLKDQNCLTLPGQTTLNKLTRHVGVPTEGADAYLRLRFQKLPEREKVVNLLLDEVYVQKHVEYANGEITGLGPGNTPASTVLCFMVSSVCAKYRDMVAFYPMSGLTAAKLNKCFAEVLQMLCEIGFQVLTVCTDNLATNRRFYSQFLCGGKLQSEIPNPITGEPLFLLLDPVHNFKNIFNNWEKKGLFIYPNIPSATAPSATPRSANFQYVSLSCVYFCKTNIFYSVLSLFCRHICDLFQRERDMPVKLAYKLSYKGLHPTSLQKTSVQWAISVFHESTCKALESYALNDGLPWQETAEFVTFIGQLWSIWNVRTPTIGWRKRDDWRNPIRTCEDTQLHFLEKAAEFFENWQKTCALNQGLSRETFLAVIHSCKTLVLIARYCLVKLQYKYVLLGKFQSDPIEKRFSWLRQLSGGNFYISVRQLIQNEKKIRTSSLIKFSHCSLTEIRSLDQENQAEKLSSKVATFCKLLLEGFSSFQAHFEPADAKAIFYVAGALVHSYLERCGCASCKGILVGSSEKLTLSEIEGDISTDIREFVDHCNRGGLLYPSPGAFGICLKCWMVFSAIRESPSLWDEFLHLGSHRTVFAKAVLQLLMEDDELEALLVKNFTCDNSHNFAQVLALKFFSCVAGNCAKRLSEKRDSSTSAKSKMRKLTSQ